MTRMKESGIDWIGQIPEEWEVKRIKNIASIERGASPRPIDKFISDDDTGVNWIRIGDTYKENKYITSTKLKITNRGKQFSRYIHPGTLILSNSMSFGEPYISSIYGCIHDGWLSLAPNNNISKEYLYWLLLSDVCTSQFNLVSIGAVVENLSVDKVGNTLVSMPYSLYEQQKIADFLDKKTAQLDKAKALLEEQIQKLKEYRASLIHETVTKGLDKNVPMKDSGIDWIGQVPQGWGVKPLKYLASYDDETLTQSEINSNRKIDYVDISSVEFTKGINGYQEFLTLEAPSRARKIAKKGDTIISTVRTYLKAIAYVNNDYIVSTGFCVVRSKKINSKYLNYTIMSDSFTGPVSKYAWGVSYPAISSGQLVNIPIPFPESIEEQLLIVDYLDHKMLQINQLIDIKQEQIDNINKQRQTLIYDYVTGKRRV